MALNVDTLQGVKMALASFNQGVVDGDIDATAINGANTYATFYSRVQANVNAEGTEEFQAGNMIVLRGLTLGNALGILTDANLNGKTTVAGVQALYTAEDSSLAAGYVGCNIA